MCLSGIHSLNARLLKIINKLKEKNMNIVIASGKGGTGKTTFAVNLAYYLSEQNKTVRLLDGDVKNQMIIFLYHLRICKKKMWQY